MRKARHLLDEDAELSAPLRTAAAGDSELEARFDRVAISGLAQRWDQALGRLKALLERDES